jgi:hypothetical protein
MACLLNGRRDYSLAYTFRRMYRCDYPLAAARQTSLGGQPMQVAYCWNGITPSLALSTCMPNMQPLAAARLQFDARAKGLLVCLR